MGKVSILNIEPEKVRFPFKEDFLFRVSLHANEKLNKRSPAFTSPQVESRVHRIQRDGPI